MTESSAFIIKESKAMNVRATSEEIRQLTAEEIDTVAGGAKYLIIAFEEAIVSTCDGSSAYPAGVRTDAAR